MISRTCRCAPLALALLSLAACGSEEDSAPQSKARDAAGGVRVALPSGTPPSDAANAAAETGTQASAGRPVAPPPLLAGNGASDPRSPAAAGASVIYYYALLSAGDFEEARTMWGSLRPASDYAAQMKGVEGLTAEIGALGDPEGAAGSIYIEVPVTLTGVRDGAPFMAPRRVTLRRANDVPGSTEAQRRWRIESIAGQGADAASLY